MVLLKASFTFPKRVQLAQTLWAACWACALAGVLTLALGVHLKCELRRHGEVMVESEVQLVPDLLILVGILSVLVNLAGVKLCGDSLDPAKLPRWRALAGPYLALSSLFTFLMLASSLLSYLMRGTLEASLKAGLHNGIRFYKDTDTPGRCYQKRTIDLIQMEFQCCGNNHHRDWFKVQWVSNRYLDFNNQDVRDRIKSNVDGRYLMDSVPFSCCNPSSPRPCIQLQITNSSAHFNYEAETEELNIWMRGCREALLAHYTGAMATAGTVALLAYVTQLGVLTGLRYLTTSTLAALDQSDLACDSDGYLLEKGVMETARTALKTLRNTLSPNQVQTDQVQTEEKAAG